MTLFHLFVGEGISNTLPLPLLSFNSVTPKFYTVTALLAFVTQMLLQIQRSYLKTKSLANHSYNA